MLFCGFVVMLQSYMTASPSRVTRLHYALRDEGSHARAILHGRGCAFRRARNAKINQADRCYHQDLSHMRVPDRTCAVTAAPTDCQPTPMGHESCASSRGRQRSHLHQPGPVSSSIVLRLRQTRVQMPARLSVLLPARGVRRHGAAPLLRVPLADGTWCYPGSPTGDVVPSLLALSDVMGTGWFAADAANVKPGMTW